VNVFASRNECFKCHTTRDGTKGKGKGTPADAPPPEKYSETLWEKPRAETGLKLIREDCTLPGVAWDYMLNDESRRSFAAFLQCPFNKDQTKQFFDTVKSEVKWDQPEGPHGPIPRKTAWMVAPGGCDCKYRYGRIEVEPQIFPPWMLQLMSVLMPLAGISDPSRWPNSCNLNLYEDGGMSVGWHSDDESLFQGKFNDIRIISFSLGVRRKFEIRANWPEEGERPIRTIMLGDGDLCTMEGMLQKHFQHRVPKEGNIDGERINLTWRWVVKHTPRCPATRMR
jgi:alkylated DNA repair dioxygenase AlkB